MRPFTAILLLSACSAYAAHLYVPVNTMLNTTVTNRKVTLTSTERVHRNSGTALIAPESVSQYTGADGTTTFSNLLWGAYRLDLQGTPSGTWSFTLDDTNALVDVTTLIGTSTVPGAATNYFTASQANGRFVLRYNGVATNLSVYDSGGNLIPYAGAAIAAGTNVTVTTNGNIYTVNSTATSSVIAAGTNVTVTTNGNTYTVNSTATSSAIAAGTNVTVTTNGNIYTVSSTATGSGTGLTNVTETVSKVSIATNLSVSGSMVASNNVTSGYLSMEDGEWKFGDIQGRRLFIDEIWASTASSVGFSTDIVIGGDTISQGGVKAPWLSIESNYVVYASIDPAGFGLFSGLGGTPLNASQLQSGTIPQGRLATNSPADGQTLVASGSDVKWDTLDGTGDLLSTANLSDLTSTSAGLTNIGAHDASNLTTGTVSIARLASGLQLLQTNNAASLTNINASNIASGTVSDSRLSANVSLLGSSIDLSGAEVTGNLPVGKLNGGSGANSSTFWAGDGTWKPRSSLSNVTETASTVSVSNLLAVGGTVSAADATNDNQLVTLGQLESYSASGEHFYFSRTNASGFGINGGLTNYAYPAPIAAAVTNNVTALSNGYYIAAFVSSETFKSFGSGVAQVEVYAYENTAGSGSMKAEIYIYNTVSDLLEYEYEPSPAGQTIAAGSTPTKLTFSVPMTDYTSTTNLRVVVRLKVTAISLTPTVSLVSGGSYPSHVTFAVPSSTYVKKAGDTMTGTLIGTFSGDGSSLTNLGTNSMSAAAHAFYSQSTNQTTVGTDEFFSGSVTVSNAFKFQGELTRDMNFGGNSLSNAASIEVGGIENSLGYPVLWSASTNPNDGTGLTNGNGSPVVFADESILAEETTTNFTLNVDKPLYIPTNLVATAFYGDGSNLSGVSLRITNATPFTLFFATNLGTISGSYQSSQVYGLPDMAYNTNGMIWRLVVPESLDTNMPISVVFYSWKTGAGTSDTVVFMTRLQSASPTAQVEAANYFTTTGAIYVTNNMGTLGSGFIVTNDFTGMVSSADPYDLLVLTTMRAGELSEDTWTNSAPIANPTLIWVSK